jgi:hypothetical protein
VSLFALTRLGIGWTAFVVGVLGFAFVLASLLSCCGSAATNREGYVMRCYWLVSSSHSDCGLQLFYGLKVISRANDLGSVDGIAVLVIVCFLIGIARSWELIGGPSIGLGSEIAVIVRARRGSPDPSPDAEN